jgi:hypothetical protein
MTVNELDKEVAKVRPALSVRGGRRPLPELTRTVRVMKKCIDAHGQLLGSHADLTRVDPALAREIFETIRQIRSACDAIAPAVDTFGEAVPASRAS